MPQNGVTRYHFANITSDHLIDEIYNPAIECGGSVKDITKQEFETHANNGFKITMPAEHSPFDLPFDLYVVGFVNEEHERNYRAIFKNNKPMYRLL